MIPVLTENDAIEVDCLLYAMNQKYGYDFRQYARGTVHRRLKRRLECSGLSNYSEMQHRILHDRAFFETILTDLSINVTEMFRAPHFFRALREHVIPELSNRPFLRIWVAGCATGEEAYSMAILLQEEGLAGRFRIYATDFNERVLHTAKEGIYPIKRIRKYTANHQLSGGCGSLVDHYTARYDHVIMNRGLKECIRFSDHNLVSDPGFGEMDLILCRNVLIYFSPSLQSRVLGTLMESLVPNGFFCLGTGEEIHLPHWSARLSRLLPKEKIYRKKMASACKDAPCHPMMPPADQPGSGPTGVLNP